MITFKHKPLNLVLVILSLFLSQFAIANEPDLKTTIGKVQIIDGKLFVISDSNSEEATELESETLPDTEELEDLHLERVLELALIRNRDIISSSYQLDTSEAQLLQARSIMGTKLTGNYLGSRVDDVGKTTVAGVTTPTGKRDSQQAYFEVTQPLYLSGKDRSAVASARLGHSATKSGHTLSKQFILLETTMSWLNWLFACEAELVSEKDLKLANTHYELVQARYKYEQISQFEVLRAEVRLAQARSNLIRDTNNKELARLDLLDILDLPSNTMIRTTDRLQIDENDFDLENDVKTALELREDLKIKRLQVKLANEGIKSINSENQPIVSAFGQSGTQDPSQKSSMGKFERKSYWRVGLSANFTIADGGLKRGKLKEAYSKLDIAKQELQNAIEKAKLEINKASLNIETAAEVVAAQQKALTQAEEALRLASVRYENGLFTQVELFDAENAFLATNLQYLQAVLAHHRASTAYKLAIGKLGRDIICSTNN